jgi:hypothetical protein
MIWRLVLVCGFGRPGDHLGNVLRREPSDDDHGPGGFLREQQLLGRAVVHDNDDPYALTRGHCTTFA